MINISFVDSQTGVFHGIPQILDLAASFVDGFKTPLKEDNIKFLLEVPFSVFERKIFI